YNEKDTFNIVYSINNISRIKRPSQVPCLGDLHYYKDSTSKYLFPIGNYLDYCRSVSGVAGSPVGPFAPISGTSANSVNNAARVMEYGSWHLRKTNFTFIDGHVDTYGYYDLSEYPTGVRGFFSFNY
ncbi:MAG: hypothetical protein WCP55_13105, partial [Lentisphaerota bacterium]